MSDIDIDFRIADTHQEYRLPNRIGDIFIGEHRFRHSREMREFVDHPSYVIDLPDDGIGALFENGTVLANHFSVFASQPFGRKLNGRERILDLMRDPSRHIRPCRRTLGGHQVR